MRAWRSIASARSSARLLAALVLFLPALAAAQKLRVAVLPVEGPQGDKATAAILRAVKKSADLVPPGEWDAAAKKLFATSRSASDLAAVAGDLAVQVVVTGKVKKGDEGWELSVGVRHGPTGKAAVKLKYPLKGKKVDEATLRKLGDDVPPALQTAATAPGGPETPESPEVAQTPAEAAAPSTEDEKPLEGRKPDEPAGDLPAWTHWVEASAAFRLGGRSFGFDEAKSPSFRSTGISTGILLDATGYPLAFLARRPSAAMNALSGIGAGATWNVQFWNDVTPCYTSVDPMTGQCSAATVDHYATNEYSWEAGLRWRWNFLRAADNRPELLANAQYGQHSFTIQRRSYLDEKMERDIGPPNVMYTYITIGAGLRFPFAKRFAAHALFNYHVVLDTGSIQTAAEWGPGGAYGLRVAAGFEVKIWRGLFGRLSGSYERFGLSFNPAAAGVKHNTQPPCPCDTTGGATDQFFGFALHAGYAY